MTLRNWILFTSLGWISGIPLLMLIGTALEPLRLENTSVAMGMSLAIAFFQWLLLRKVLAHASRWIWISAIAFVIPFLIADLSGDALFSTGESAVVGCTVVSSILLGATQQHFLLNGVGIKRVSWIAINLFSYALALVPPFALNLVVIKKLQLPAALAITLSFLTVFAGGPIIGWLTGKVLVKHLPGRQGV